MTNQSNVVSIHKDAPQDAALEQFVETYRHILREELPDLTHSVADAGQGKGSLTVTLTMAWKDEGLKVTMVSDAKHPKSVCLESDAEITNGQLFLY